MKNDLCDIYIVEFIHDATENYYEGGIYACSSCNNIKFPLYVRKVLKLCLFYLPMQVDSCSHKLFAHKDLGHFEEAHHWNTQAKVYNEKFPVVYESDNMRDALL